MNCHRGISDIHPNGAEIGCAKCHGGDDSTRPFIRAGADVETLLTTADPNIKDPNGKDPVFVPINPTDIADGRVQVGNNPFQNGGRESQAFQVLLTSAHNLPKGCAGPKEIVAVSHGDIDPDGSVDLDGDGAPEDRVHFEDLAPGQQADLKTSIQADPNGVGKNDDCHAVFFWPNGMDDDGNGLVDEIGEFSLFNPQDPEGLQYDFSKIDTNGDGSIGPGDATFDPVTNTAAVSLAQAKTIPVDLNGDGTIQPGELIPVKLGQNLDSEFAMDVNYVRFMNPGDVRTAQASCGRNSPASSFAGNCHDLEVDTTRSGIMSYLSGVLAGALYMNGAIPSNQPLTDPNGFTDRSTQDLREGRIGYVQNYNSLDQAFDPELNRYPEQSLDGVNDQSPQGQGTITDLGDIFVRSRQNQLDLDKIFGITFGHNSATDINSSGLDQDDCLDGKVTAGNAQAFTGNLCLESYSEAIFRVDDAQIAEAAKNGVTDPNTIDRATTKGGTFTVEHGGDLFSNRRPGNRLVWTQEPLQDKARALFVMAPIPRRTLVGNNADLLANADTISKNVTGQGIAAALLLPQATENVIDPATGILDDRQFSNRVAGINPVDTALQTFRPFHSLSFPNITGDFFFFDEFQLIDPRFNTNVNFNTFVLRNNPHGRGRGSGCTSCHVPYDQDGLSRESDPTVKFNGKQPGDVVLGRSPLVNSGHGLRTGSLFNGQTQVGDLAENGTAQAVLHIEIGEAQKWQQVNGLIAQALKLPAGTPLPRLQFPTGMDDYGRERFYPSQHKITTQIRSELCERCHAFVTRIGFAAVGRHENEGGMEFINWYTWTPKDQITGDAIAGSAVGPDGLITHAGRDVNGGNGFNDAEADLGEFVANRPAPPEEDFLEFRNALDPTQKVRIFNNLPSFGVDAQGNNPTLFNTGERFTEDLNNNGLLDAGENVSDLANGAALDLPDRAARDQIVDGRQERNVYGGASGAVSLGDIHLEKGMHCIDCHFFQDNHGDGNVYGRNWDSIEIKCIDCHGTATKLATLVTSGPNGGHDLTLSKDQFGVPFFELGGKGERIQRSRVVNGRQWRVPQIVDAINPNNEQFNPDAAEAMAVLDSNGDGLNAHIAENTIDANGIQRTGFGKLNCSSCHSSWTPNCMTCHMDFDYSQTVGEIWYTQNRNPISFFQLFTIVRAPFMLAFAGSDEGNKIMTQRSLMELHPNITLNTGDALAEDFTFSTARGVSGVAMNQYMSHTVRLKETKDCDSCHTLTPDNLQALQGEVGGGKSPFDGILNNGILSQTLGLGSGRLNEPGDFFFGASSAGGEGIDVKAEARRALDPDGDGVFQFFNTVAGVENPGGAKNTFQGFRGQGFGAGFMVASDDIQAPGHTELNVNRSFSIPFAGGGASDAIFIRNFIDPTEKDENSGLFVGEVRGTDIVVMAGNNQLDTRVVVDRTQGGFSALNLGASVALPGVTAIDAISPDMSDPFVYAVTANGDIAVVDLRVMFLNAVGSAANGFVTRKGFNGQKIAAQKNFAGSNFQDVEIDGNFAFVLDNQGANPAKLRIIDARKESYFDREVTAGNGQFHQFAVDFELQEPGSLNDLANGGQGLPLQLNGVTCTDPRKVAIMNVVAYVACGKDGLFAVNIEDPLNPHVIGVSQDAAKFDPANPGTSQVIAGGLSDAQGLFVADNRLFVANGVQAAPNNGVQVFDVTEPRNPRPVRLIQKLGAGVARPMTDPVDITGFVEPGQLWILVSDATGFAHAINVTEAYNIRVRLGEHAAAARGVIAGQNDEANGSKPGFRPQDLLQDDLSPFFSQSALNGSAGLAQPRQFFEDTNVRYTLDLRDPTTPNDPANIDEILNDGQTVNGHLIQQDIVSFQLFGTGDIRLAQTEDLDRYGDWSGFMVRDSMATSVNINQGCTTKDDGTFSSTDCASDDVNQFGQLGARALTGPVVNGTSIVRGEMDKMRGVFVREENGVDLDGNGLGNMVCEGVATRDNNGSVNGLNACVYPDDVAQALSQPQGKAKAARATDGKTVYHTDALGRYLK